MLCAFPLFFMLFKRVDKGIHALHLPLFWCGERDFHQGLIREFMFCAFPYFSCSSKGLIRGCIFWTAPLFMPPSLRVDKGFQALHLPLF